MSAMHDEMTARPPRVTLGVPVYNGERHLEDALDALQAQTWAPLEILISDNASVDRTEAICRRHAAGDPRIRYVRQATNIGAARNFEFVAREARGEYFAWCAHDDRRHPRFVEACVEELLRRPEATVCNTAVTFLDEKGDPMDDWTDRNFQTRGLTRPERAQRLIDHVNWVDVYGLIHREALLRCLPFEPVWGGDVVVSMKLLMLGDFAKVDDRLFQYRAWTRPMSPEKVMSTVTGSSRRVARPYTEMIQALLRAAMDGAPSREEKVDLVARFLRTLTKSEPSGVPFTCWRRILTDEHRESLGTDLPVEAFPRHLLGWLSEALPGAAESRGREAMALALAGVRRVLLAAPGAPEDAMQMGPVLQLLARRVPGAHLGILWPSTAPDLPPLIQEHELVPYVPMADARSEPRVDRDGDLLRVRAWKPDLVICPFPGRSRRLDRLATGSGALLGIAFSEPARPGRRSWLRSAAPYNPDRRWGFVLPVGGSLSDIEACLDGLQVGK